MERATPAYNLDEIKGLVCDGLYRIGRRAIAHIDNHDLEASSLVEDVFESVVVDDFKKSITLDNPHLPNVYADVYIVPLDIGDWYLKFFKDDDGDGVVVVLSLNEHGAIH